MQKGRVIANVALAATLLLGGTATAAGNRFDRFSIQQCFESDCVIARSAVAFVNNVGQSISASHVTLEIRKDGKSHVYACDDFRADMVANDLVCDNRNTTAPSVIVSKDLRVSIL